MLARNLFEYDPKKQSKNGQPLYTKILHSCNTYRSKNGRDNSKTCEWLAGERPNTTTPSEQTEQ